MTSVTRLGTILESDTSETVSAYDDIDCGVEDTDRGIWYQLPASVGITDAVTATVSGQTFTAQNGSVQ
jgi:hypothetical protein